MSYQKPVVRDYGDIVEMTASGVVSDQVNVCNSVDVCVGGVLK